MLTSIARRALGSVRRTAAAQPQRRGLGGGAHHGPPKPYDPYHAPSVYGETAVPFNMKPGEMSEYWVLPVVATYLGMFGLILFGEVQQDNETTIVSTMKPLNVA